ncbi:MAG TPA: right-handed parallel beta-helix repeat-containing protein [Mucilaginibacter sp.]|nr:right-handed parallel beta-helix repeat-containing protein [Mucilaginibacter sp.]
MRKNLILSLTFLLCMGAAARGFCQRHKYSEPIVIKNAHDLVIRGDSINGDDEPCLQIINCNNIRITHCFLGNSSKVGLYIYQSANIKVDSTYVTNVSTGVYAVDSYAISVMHCEGKNMVGPFPRGAFVQFNNVSGPRCRVCYNKFENILGQSHPEDAINIYKSHGIAKDPILIAGNWIRGGGPSKTGGGIMLGDNGGSYQVARDNILVNPGQYGMAISGGDHLAIINNKIYARGQIFTNVGLYIWAQAEAACSMDEISGNEVNWTNSRGEQNCIWDQGNCGDVKGWKTNTTEAKISESLLPEHLLSPSAL